VAAEQMVQARLALGVTEAEALVLRQVLETVLLAQPTRAVEAAVVEAGVHLMVVAVTVALA